MAHAQELDSIQAAPPQEGITVRTPIDDDQNPTTRMNKWEPALEGKPIGEWEATIQGKVRPLQLWPRFLAPCQWSSTSWIATNYLVACEGS